MAKAQEDAAGAALGNYLVSWSTDPYKALHYTGNHARNEKTLASTQPVLLDALASARKVVSDANLKDQEAQQQASSGQRAEENSSFLDAVDARLSALGKMRAKVRRVPLKVGMIASADRRVAVEEGKEGGARGKGAGARLPFDAWYQLNFGERYKRFLTAPKD